MTTTSTAWRLDHRDIFSSINDGGDHDDDGNSSILIILSFLGGVVSSSFVWWWWYGQRRCSSSPPPPKGQVFTTTADDDDDDDPRRLFCHSRSRSMTLDDVRDSLEELKSRLGELPTALDDLKNRLSDFPSSLDDIRSRIGELPSLTRRTRWPWDRIRTKNSVVNEEEDATADATNTTTTTTSPEKTEPFSRNKSDFCIGSIFGLDVGGTLGKLVYFEQKFVASSSTESIGTIHQRERSYRAAASAQAVVMARAEERLLSSSSSSTPSSPEKTFSPPHHRQHRKMMHSRRSSEDLANLNRLRQESVPDDLHAYAETVHLTKNNKAASSSLGEGRNDDDGSDNDEESTIMRKSRSMLDFGRHRAEALDHFYNFARRLDSYREGLKDDKLSFYSRELQGEFHFIHFETRRMQQAMDLIRTNQLHLNIREMGATGGGAHKFASKWEEELGISMKKQGEMDSLVAGLQFVLTTVVGECYSFRPRNQKKFATAGSMSSSSGSEEDAMSNDVFLSEAEESNDTMFPVPNGSSDNLENSTNENTDRGSGDEWWWSRKVRRDSISYSSTYPYLVVTIGTGVSILRVDGPRKFERISGSTIGGGTYWGLIRLLTDVEDFDDVLKLAARGDPSKVDMMVGDIYGDNSDALDKLGLPADLVASSFGKLVAKEDPASGLKQEDLARALLLMITINIGQVAYLNAKLSKTSRIYFVGNFLRQNKISQRRLAFAIDYWSKGEMEALFLEHEGYFGALGAFLLSRDDSQDPEESKKANYRRSNSLHVSSGHHIDPAKMAAKTSATPNRRTSTMPYI